MVLQLGADDKPTKFVTLDFKLEEYFAQEDIKNQLTQIEDLYFSIDTCQEATDWRQDTIFKKVYHRHDGQVVVSLVSKERLVASLTTFENWDTNFVAEGLFSPFKPFLTNPYPNIYDTFRGERTGWNPMFILRADGEKGTGIEPEFLTPYVKSSSELERTKFFGDYNFSLFTCEIPIEELEADNPGAFKWVQKFVNVKNKNGTKTIPEACASYKPFWFSLKPKLARIVTSINPYKRFFFTYSDYDFAVDQRLIGFQVKEGYDVELIAALLNSVVTLLTIEMKGTDRNLGVLDLNANYFRNLQILNPNLLSEKAKEAIKEAFTPLTERAVFDVYQETRKEDRIEFDKTVLRAFGINENILLPLYQILRSEVSNRVEMKDR